MIPIDWRPGELAESARRPIRTCWASIGSLLTETGILRGEVIRGIIKIIEESVLFVLGRGRGGPGKRADKGLGQIQLPTHHPLHTSTHLVWPQQRKINPSPPA